MATPQSKFNLITPTNYNDTSNIATGEITGYIIQTANSNFTFTPPATWAPGSAQSIPFSALNPVFTPVGGQSYTADIEAVASNGQDSVPSASITWTQVAKSPNPPTGFGVA